MYKKLSKLTYVKSESNITANILYANNIQLGLLRDSTKLNCCKSMLRWWWWWWW